MTARISPNTALRSLVGLFYGALSGLGFLTLLALLLTDSGLLPFLKLDDAGVGQAIRMFAAHFAVAGAVLGASVVLVPALLARARTAA